MRRAIALPNRSEVGRVHEDGRDKIWKCQCHQYTSFPPRQSLSRGCFSPGRRIPGRVSRHGETPGWFENASGASSARLTSTHNRSTSGTASVSVVRPFGR